MIETNNSIGEAEPLGRYKIIMDEACTVTQLRALDIFLIKQMLNFKMGIIDTQIPWSKSKLPYHIITYCDRSV
jgi:hypothetical protein